MSIWNEELEKNLIDLWNKGISTAEIGRILGVTKNSVIGKAHRLKLQKRESCIKYKKEVKTSVKEVITPDKNGIETENGFELVAEDRVTTPCEHKKHEEKKKEQKHLITLMDLGPNMCHWPVGDPKDDDFHFCGCKTHNGKIYCDYHNSIAYVQVKK